MNILKIRKFFCQKALDVLFTKNDFKFYPNYQTFWDTHFKRVHSYKLEELLPAKEKVLIIPIMERQYKHDLYYLINNNLTAINLKLKNNEELDLIIHNKQAWHIARLKDSGKRLYHIKVGNKEVTCLLRNYILNNDNTKMYKLKFEVFTEGEDNIIDVDLKILPSKHFFNQNLKDYNLKWYFSKIKLATKIKDYPKLLFLNPIILVKNGKILVGDLHNMLSNNIKICDKSHKNFEEPIVKFDIFYNKRESYAYNILEKLKIKKEEVKEEDDDDINLEDFLINPKSSFEIKKSKNPKPFVKRIRSFKERIEIEKKKLKLKSEYDFSKKK